MLTISKGNKKLVSNEKTRFLIWNLPAKITCPYATEQCKKLCYAVKAEKMYKAVLPSRQRNLEESRKETFVSEMCKTIEKLISSPSYRKAEKIFFRIHESGDFYNQKYFNDWVKIARRFPQVVFLAYTKSVRYVLNTTEEIPANMIIRFSLWADTKAEEKAIAEDLNLPTYTAERLTESQIKALDKRFCDCKDCGTCGKCYDTEVKHIVCEIH